MSKARLWFAALLALHGLSCSSLPVLSGTEAIIRVPNEALDFGVVPLGEVLTLPLHIKNEGRSGAQAAISTAAAAFSVEVESVTLPGGEEVVVPVSFRPKTTGAASARVLVTSGALQFEVSLLGTGVAPCVTAACHSARFDPATRRCELIALADGATCVVPCIADGQCRQGECRGRSQLCDDADPCTADACDANGGCTHHPIVCPVTDSCRAAVCEPGIGCVERPLEDGTACGPADCLTARVCINTHCSSRPTPDSADCQYTSVAANADSLTCATTVSGKVRCWGGPALLQPREVPELRGGVRLAAPPERGMCAVDAASSSVRCFDVVAPDGGFGSPVRQLTPPHVVLEDGRYSTWDDTGALTLQHTGVHALAVTKIPGVATIRCLDEGGPLVCEAQTGRGSSWSTILSPALPGAAWPAGGRLYASVAREGVCASWPEGQRCASAVWGVSPDGGYEFLWDEPRGGVDAGLLAAGFGRHQPAYWVSGSMVLPTSGTGGSFALPAPAIQVTNGAAPCALTANHEVWCWGSDRRGGLGLLTGNPSGPQLLATRADVMVVTNEATLLLNDAGLFQVGDHPVVMAESDAGYAFGAIWLGRPPPARTLFSSSGVWGITSDGMAWTTSIPGDPRGVSPSAAVDAGPALSIGLSGLESIILRPSGTVETRRGSVVATDVTQLSGSCLLFRDGGVSCASSAGTFVRVPLPPGVEQISDGCAFIPPSQVRCWDQTAVVWPVSGIGTGVRRLVGTAGAGCVLIGSNLAQCWGSNPQGNSTPSLRKAVPVVFDEAIADISPGRSHICARAYSGKVWCWGSNSWGQLGITPVDSYNAPVKMAR